MIFNEGKTVHIGRTLHKDRKLAVLLGALVSINAATKPNVEHRLGKARKAFGALRRSVFGNRELPLSTKINIFEACVVSLYHYSLDAFSLSRGDL